MPQFKRRAGLAVALTAVLIPHAADAAILTARPAGQFRDSVGINTHVDFTAYPYEKTSTATLQGLLHDLGVAHIRDRPCFNTPANCSIARTKLAALAASNGPGGPGIGIDLLVAPRLQDSSGALRATQLQQGLDAASTAPLHAVTDSLESANEPDLSGQADWATSATAMTRSLVNDVATNPAHASIANLPVVGPATGRPANIMGVLGVTGPNGWSPNLVAAGNVHSYPADYDTPEAMFNSRPKASETALCDGGTIRPEDSVSAALRCEDAVTGNSPTTPKPNYVTESGYTTYSNQLGNGWVSEKAAGIYTPRILLENFRRGAQRTYLYELLDLKPTYGGSGDAFGLVRAKYSGTDGVAGSPKPAFTAVSRMLSVIGNLGSTNTLAGTLGVSVSGPTGEVPVSEVRRLLLRRSNGTYVLALWQPKVVFSATIPLNHKDVTVAPTTYRVTIGPSTLNWNVSRYTPSTADGAVQTWSGVKSFTVPVGADVTLLDLSAAF